MEKKQFNYCSKKDKCNFIVSVLFVCFFVMWFFIAAVGDELILLINNAGLSGWVQAVGSLILIAVTIIIWYNDKEERKQKEDQLYKVDKTKFRIYLSSNYYLISNLDRLFHAYELFSRVADKRQARNLPNFRRNCYMQKAISSKINDVVYDFSSLIIQFEVDSIPQIFIDRILSLRDKVLSLGVLNQLLFQDYYKLLDKYKFNGDEEFLSSDVPEIDELEDFLNFNFQELPKLMIEIKSLVDGLKSI